MTYKYYEETLDGYRDFNIVDYSNSDYIGTDIVRRLRPLYFNECGRLFYDKNYHIGADIKIMTIKLLESFMTDFKTTVSLTDKSLDFKKLYDNLFLSLFSNPSSLSMNEVRSFINCKPEPYDIYDVCTSESINIFTSDAMLICNSVIETYHQVKKKLYYIASISVDTNELLFNILKYFKVNVDLIRKNIEQDQSTNAFILCNCFSMDSYLENIVNDMLVCLVGLDKIESSVRKCITTSKRNVNEVFFNYLIMDYKIVSLPKLVYDCNTNSIHELETSLCDYGLEREFEQEVKLIRKLVPKEMRYKYFI